jgi:hypothetical protein
MIETLVSSKTRAKILFKFFLNPSVSSYLRKLEVEFGESTNGIRIELNRLEKAGILVSRSEKNKKLFSANMKHPLFDEIHNIIIKQTEMCNFNCELFSSIAGLEQAWLTGDLANGIESNTIELLLVAEDSVNDITADLFYGIKKQIKREIRHVYIHTNNAGKIHSKYPKRMLLYWKLPQKKGNIIPGKIKESSTDILNGSKRSRYYGKERTQKVFGNSARNVYYKSNVNL